jgi:hypothetical protein
MKTKRIQALSDVSILDGKNNMSETIPSGTFGDLHYTAYDGLCLIKFDEFNEYYAFPTSELVKFQVIDTL